MASELGVQTIQHTNGTDALTVSSDGVVTAAEYVKQSGVPAFHVYYLPTTITPLTGHIQFNTVVTNQGSHWDVSGNYFQAPVAGVYHFNFVGFSCDTGAGAAVSAGQSSKLRLETSTDSGTTWNLATQQFGFVQSSAYYPSMSFGISLYLDASEQVRLRAELQAIYSDQNFEYAPHFSGYLVG